MKRLLSNLLLVAATVVSALLIFEAGCRVLMPDLDPSGQVRLLQLPNGTPIGMPFAKQRQAKNTGDYDVEIEFNDAGFRDDKLISRARPGDVLVVGDSFAFGWGVRREERFSDRIARAIDRQVYNVAMPGTHISDYEALVAAAQSHETRFGSLIVSVTMENDLADYEAITSGTSEVAEEGLWDGTVWHSAIADLKGVLSANSALYALLTRAVHRSPRLKQFAVDAHLLVPNLRGIGSAPTDPAVIKSSARALAKLFNGRRGLVLIVPSRQLWVGSVDERESARKVHADFIRIVRAQGLVVADPTESFERSGAPLKNHFPNDGHWNARGHELAAALVIAECRQQPQVCQ